MSNRRVSTPPIAAPARFVAARIGAGGAMGFGNGMNDHQNNGGGVFLFLAATLLPTSGVLAQTVPVPQETPRTIPGLVIATPTPSAPRSPVPVPTGPVMGLPAPLSTPTAAPTPRGVPASTPTPTMVARRVPRVAQTPSVAPSPADRPSSTPAPAPTPTPTPTPAPSPTASAIPAPVSVPSATSTPAPVAVATAAAPEVEDHAAWPWLPILGGAAMLAALAAWAFFRRRSVAAAVAEPEPAPEPAPGPAPVSPVAAVAPPPPSPPAGPRARIDIALRPLRAGLNMLSAVVEAEVLVTNSGDASAEQVRIHATLLSAHGGQDADLAATFAAASPGRPAAPPFALAAGEERRVRVVAALSREAVRSMEAGGRLMFVPLVAIDVRYAANAEGRPGRASHAFIVGVERVDSAKLAPFWLDGPLRMHDQVAARAQGAPSIA